MTINEKNIAYIFHVNGIDDNDYIKNVITSTSTILNMLRKLRDNKSSAFRLDKQIRRGVGYINKTLFYLSHSRDKNTEPRLDRYLQKRTRSIKNTISFLYFLLNYELIIKPVDKDYITTITNLENILTISQDIISDTQVSKSTYLQLEEYILSLKNIIKFGKNEMSHIDGYTNIIDLFNRPTENDIFKAAIYHIARILFEHELKQSSDLLIDYQNERNIFHLDIASSIITYLFKDNYKNIESNFQDYSAFEYKNKWTGFIYKEYVLGLLLNEHKSTTGYSTISNYHAYTPTNKGGFKTYFFPDKILKYNF